MPEYIELNTKNRRHSDEKEHDVAIVFHVKNPHDYENISVQNPKIKSPCIIIANNHEKTGKIVRILFSCETVEVIPEVCIHFVEQIRMNSNVYLKKIQIDLLPEIDIIFPPKFNFYVHTSNFSYTKVLFHEEDLPLIPFQYRQQMNHKVEIGNSLLYGTDGNTQNKLLFTLCLHPEISFCRYAHVVLSYKMSKYNNAKKLKLGQHLENAGFHNIPIRYLDLNHVKIVV